MPEHKKIVVSKNGPYLVSGSVPMSLLNIGVDDKGLSTQWVEGKSFPASDSCKLCRCGSSGTKPFCDGTHRKTAFDGTETASHETVMDQAEVMDGPVMQLADAEVLCAYARFCDPNGRIWNQVGHTDNPRVRGHFIQQAGDCPAGRLLAIDKANRTVVEPKLPQSIGVVEDPANGCSGPLWVRGGIELTGADGRAYEVRNRMTLCRCGRSENKPFCNGAHAADPKFVDGIPD
jgi:CDGSH-type Zn-finger protein